MCIRDSFTAGAQDVLLRRMLGVLLIALSVYFIFFNGKITLRPTIVNGLIVGALCGVTNVLFGIGGPPVVIYLLAVSQSKEAYQGTVQAYFALSDLYTLALRISGGLVTGQVLGLWGLGLLALGAGLVVGRMVFQRLKPATVRKLVYAVMALSGVTLLFAR